MTTAASKLVFVQTRIEAELQAELLAKAEAADRSVAAEVRQAIRAWVESPSDHAKGRCERSNKLRFETKADALVKALRISANPRVGAGTGSVYRCPFCGDWHLTSKPRRSVA
jgi:hypothetical protein